MSEKKFVGKGWQFKYGINISLSKKLLDTIPVNQYGDIKLSVVRRREPDPKTKAQYYVCEDTYKKEYKEKQTKNYNDEIPFE